MAVRNLDHGALSSRRSGIKLAKISNRPPYKVVVRVICHHRKNRKSGPVPSPTFAATSAITQTTKPAASVALRNSLKKAGMLRHVGGVINREDSGGGARKHVDRPPGKVVQIEC